MRFITLILVLGLANCCSAQTPSKETQEAQALALQLSIANAQLTTKVTDLQNRLAIAESRIKSLESANEVLTAENQRLNAKLETVTPQSPSALVAVQPDPSTVQVNKELAANLRLQRALAIANAFKTQPVQVPLVTIPQPRPPVFLNPQINCITSATSSQSIVTTCQ
jgi:transcriptional regulator with PAS, ATPase and Fis domain